MPSLTDTAIRQAMKRVELTGKQQNLANGEGRGTGRLVLVLKPMPTRVTADWMAQQWRNGKRVKKKLGSYPSMSLAQAREVFKRDFADVIQRGRSIKIAPDTRPGTVADLFEGYVAALKAAGKPSWKETEKGLNKIADSGPSFVSSRRAAHYADRAARRGDCQVACRSMERRRKNYRLVQNHYQPHAVPVPSLAAELIDSIKPNEFGWFFPSAKAPSKPVSHGTLYSFVWRQRDRGVIPYATNRDLRPTFKTLASKAGVPKELRDRLQNHALQTSAPRITTVGTTCPKNALA